MIATWCFVFIGTIRELSATILLTTANTKLVSVIIYDLNESGDMGAISVLGLTLLVGVVRDRPPGQPFADARRPRAASARGESEEHA